MGLYTEFVSVSERGSVVVTNAGVEPLRPTEKFSSMGERDVGSKTDLVGEFEKPSSPAEWSSSGGGVGVRGGSGIGRSNAIAVVVVFPCWLYAINMGKWSQILGCPDSHFIARLEE